MKYAAWGAENPSGARFCELCRARMELRCTNCGTAARSGARFCVSCGPYFKSQSSLRPRRFLIPEVSRRSPWI
ncbi:MAG: zinc ribbon domain-containing protein [Deltaproteobacteria bacterium]|nr:zinc ribbon domain-containing protein [Deltaproteobacteria bacterium]